jgi:hypothetical protein
MCKKNKKGRIFHQKKTSQMKWGPAFWETIHTVASIPDIGKHYEFFELLPDILPCKMCSDHLRDIYTKLPIDVSSPAACSKWAFDVHNEVNVLTGKKKHTHENTCGLWVAVLILVGIIVAAVIISRLQ